MVRQLDYSGSYVWLRPFEYCEVVYTKSNRSPTTKCRQSCCLISVLNSLLGQRIFFLVCVCVYIYKSLSLHIFVLLRKDNCFDERKLYFTTRPRLLVQTGRACNIKLTTLAELVNSLLHVLTTCPSLLLLLLLF